MAGIKGDCVVLVRKLDPNTKEKELKDFLEEVGEIINIQFGKDSLTNEFTGSAHCAYENCRSAQRAISSLNGKLLGVNELEVREVPRSHLVMHSNLSDSSSPSPKIQTVFQNSQKLSLFSGAQKHMGGEVPFEVWRHEVECLQRDEGLSPESLARLVRRSLRGEAGQLVLNMGLDISVIEIVDKLEGFYGTVETGAVLLQQLYSSKQEQSESIAAYSARLQLIIDKAEQRQGISRSAKDDTIKVVFWKGLCDEQLKQALRHKYESIGSFDALVRAARLAEQESRDFGEFHAPSQRPRTRVGAHSNQVDNNRSDLEREVKYIREKLKQMEMHRDRNTDRRSQPPVNRPRGPRGALL